MVPGETFKGVAKQMRNRAVIITFRYPLVSNPAAHQTASTTGSLPARMSLTAASPLPEMAII